MLRLISSRFTFYWYPVNRFACPFAHWREEVYRRLVKLARVRDGAAQHWQCEGSQVNSAFGRGVDCAAKIVAETPAPVFLMTHRTLRRSRRSKPFISSAGTRSMWKIPKDAGTRAVLP